MSALKSGGTNWATYTYYQDGGLKTRTYPATGETWTFLYDGDDQLKRVVKSVGASVTAKEDYLYTYDGARTVVVKRNASDAATEVRRFVGDQEAKFSPAGAVLETFAHVTMGTVLARVKDRTTYEHQFHGLGGSTLVAVATSGAVNTAFTYGPYGEVVEATGADVVGHRRRMNDKYQDEVSGLGYYGVRYYDQVLMGWTQGDPLYRYRPEAGWGEPRRGQLYAFNLRNPVRYVDPDGMNPAGAAAGAGAGALIGGGIEAARQLWNWDFDGGRLASKAAGGAVAGGLIGATNGLSLTTSTTALWAGGSAVAGEAVSAALQGETMTPMNAGMTMLQAATVTVIAAKAISAFTNKGATTSASLGESRAARKEQGRWRCG